MKTLSTNTDNLISATITTPAYFIELGYSLTIRLSSRSEQSWNGQVWTGGRLGKITVGDSGVIEIINSDLAYSALVLNEGAADIECNIWKYYGDNPSITDPVLIFKGVINGANINNDRIRLRLSRENSRTLYSPRRFIGPATGFNHLRPTGSRILWGGQVYILERDS